MAVVTFHFSEAVVHQDAEFSPKYAGKSTTCSILILGTLRHCLDWGGIFSDSCVKS
jgi:hypothetical protein